MGKLWGGRFGKATHHLVEEFTGSIHFDQKLARQDVVGSLCHIEVLKKAGLLTASEHRKLAQALNSILKSINGKTFKADPSFEDIHSYIQHLVEKKAGKASAKLHTCRSRNDQVVFDVKLYTLENLTLTEELLGGLIQTLTALSAATRKVYIPGYTHLQHAMPVSLGGHFKAYTEMLKRDGKRLAQAFGNIRLTLGAGALAGTMIPASRYALAKKGLLPKNVEANTSALDTVSDRDFVIETLSALSLIGMHLSRLAEDMILWSSKEFDFVDIDDAFCTGSSLMPQKKNPDVLELVRGYSGYLYGNLLSVLVLMKGLPLSYNRDMQLDKEPLFGSFDIVQKELRVLTELFKNISFKLDNIAKQLDDESLYATDLADHLVKGKVPFQQAHRIVGQLIRYKYASGKDLRAMTDSELKAFHPSLSARAVRQIIDPGVSVSSKKSVKP